ncbi:MAG TPA: plasmid pRiA4b ORF-3 family protein [Candidatus Aminicenantes bacterium]|nr:plasmid pRiA4b ORF-3 family protein [Candidatus Aminicenantes bacterium]
MRVYRLKIELVGSDPPIWRRIQVPGEITLSLLHKALQAAMGWENCHLHEFKIGEVSYGSAAESDDPFAIGLMEDKAVRLMDVLTPRTKNFEYVYDFGDDWVHKITVEDFATAEDSLPALRCLGGERACPPEDCGGIYGYYEYLEILKNPGHPEYEDIKEWMGRYDPERFDLDRVNTRLKRLSK